MADVYRLPDVVRVEKEAADWIARLNADRPSAEEIADFAAWRNTHALNARTYDAMSAAWRAFNATGPVVRAVCFGNSMNEVTQPPRRTMTRRWLVAATAAAGVVLTVVSLYWTSRLRETRFQTAIGEHASISLTDGSSIELNSNSAVRVEYSEHARVIQLPRGEAFFTVTRDPTRPFWVVGGGSWVRAVGTAFSVSMRPEGVRVTVSEGAVQVGTSARSASGEATMQERAQRPASLLSAGQQVDVHAGNASVRTVVPAEIQRLTAWRTGKVSFEKQPLSTVIEELSRYTTLEIIVSDEKLRQLLVGGTFQANPQGMQTLLAMLRDGFDLQIRRERDRVYIEYATALRPE